MAVKTFSNAKDGATQITANFKISEFACKDGSDPILLDDRLPRVLQRIRELCGNKPLTVSSGYRNVAYNAKIGGAPNSYHTRGQAADITIAGVIPETMCRAAETALTEAGIQGGICIYPTFTHVDTRDVRWRGENDGKTTRNRTSWTPLPTPITSSATTAAPASSVGNDKIIWDNLKCKGLNDFAASGLMGNLEAESGLHPNNLENWMNTYLGISDSEFTRRVDDGTYNREWFINRNGESGRGSNGGWGYGLAQWTFWSRKEKLYDYAKSSGTSIGDLTMQTEFLWSELQGYTKVMNVLRSAKSVLEASNVVLMEYEKPANMGAAVQAQRAALGQKYYDKFAVKTSLPLTPPVGFKPYAVRVTGIPLNIRSGPGTHHAIIGSISDRRICVIFDESQGQGAQWGCLEGNAGWISLDFTEKV